MILLIDNYDSFTYNLYQLAGKYTNEIHVARNDKISIEKVKKLNPTHIIISPGPGNPKNKKDFGICKEIIREFKNTPLLGVCLGHQGIYTSYGGDIKKTKPVHGKKDIICHSTSKIFTDIPDEFDIIRYHSLICDESTLPKNIKITSQTKDGIIMSIEHKEYPSYGIQFHPESIGSQYGHKVIENFLNIQGND